MTERIANLGKAPLAGLSTELNSLDLRMAASGEAPVPGGIKAFSAVAQLKGVPSYQDFFLEYCRAITEGGPTGASPAKEAGEEVRAFISAVAALETLGEHRENSTLIHLSMGNEEQIRKSRAIVAELGWKLVSRGDGYSLEPGDPGDGAFRPPALSGLGVDELALRQAIQEKRDFEFEIPRENARLVGGPAWGLLLKGIPEAAGGPDGVAPRGEGVAQGVAGGQLGRCLHERLAVRASLQRIGRHGWRFRGSRGIRHRAGKPDREILHVDGRIRRSRGSGGKPCRRAGRRRSPAGLGQTGRRQSADSGTLSARALRKGPGPPAGILLRPDPCRRRAPAVLHADLRAGRGLL